MIRLLTSSDLDEAMDLLQKFRDSAPVPGRLDRSVFSANWNQLFELGAGTIIGYFSENKLIGCIGLILSKDINDADMVAQEAFWFVDPSKRGIGIKLLMWAEKWAKDNGFVRILMGHLNNEEGKHLPSIFSRLGYSPAEVTYVKTLKC